MTIVCDKRRRPKPEEITEPVVYPRFPVNVEPTAWQPQATQTKMTIRGKLALSVLIVGIATLGAYRWGGYKLVDKLFPKKPAIVTPHRVQWVDGVTENNWKPSQHPPLSQGQRVTFGFLDDGTVVWKAQ